MPADKPRPSLADYVTILISPALVIAMIVSLVFFLLAVLYRGEFVYRLHAVLFFFVFGMVLVARIAMATGYAARAPVYGAVLAVLTWIGLTNFVTYPAEAVAAKFINAGLIALAWWLAHQLTHSCTYIDERAENTGTGLMDAAELQNGQAPEVPAGRDEPDQQPGKRRKQPKPSWWVRFRQFREKRRNSQPPGLWIVYFAVAALAIFGLGQALIDVADGERRAYTFQLMTIYLASALALLMTTAFLGLRRYLRQRRLEMPKTVTAAWLIVGTTLVVCFIAIGALLPRPRSEYSLLDVGAFRSNMKSASPHAATAQEPAKDEPNPNGQSPDDKAGAGKNGQRNGAKQTANKDAKEGAAKSAGNQEQAKSKSESDKSTDSQGKRDSKPENNGASAEQTPPPPETSAGSSFLSSVFSQLSKLLKWIVFGVLLAVALLYLAFGGLRYLANFTDWARSLLEWLRQFWAGLFAAQSGSAIAANDTAEALEATGASFESFANPFGDGRAARMTPPELIEYSFEALEAWARDHDSQRAREETPLEFSHRLAEEVGALDEETKRLGALYACVLYARDALPPSWRDTLESFWMRISCA